MPFSKLSCVLLIITCLFIAGCGTKIPKHLMDNFINENPEDQMAYRGGGFADVPQYLSVFKRMHNVRTFTNKSLGFRCLSAISYE